jgi:hypothetical protein
VLDNSGKPVAGAIQWLAYRSDDGILLDQTTGAIVAAGNGTDEQGKFRVVLDKPGVSVALRVAGLPSAGFTGPSSHSKENGLSTSAPGRGGRRRARSWTAGKPVPARRFSS